MLLDAKKTQIMIEKYFIKRFLSLDGDYRYIFFWFTFFLAIQRPKHFHKIWNQSAVLSDEQQLHNFYFPVVQREICCFDSKY